MIYPFVNIEYCLTEACVHTAANILSSIDPTVNPCDDFYEFSCGNWIRLNPIPTGKAQWNTFSKLEYQTELILKDILGMYSQGRFYYLKKIAFLFVFTIQSQKLFVTLIRNRFGLIQNHCFWF